MTYEGWLLILVFAALVVAITKPFGMGLFAIMEGRRTSVPSNAASTRCRGSIPMPIRAGTGSASTCCCSTRPGCS